MEKKAFIQIGVTALRTSTGGFLPSVPLYIEESNLGKSGLTPAHEEAIHNIAGFFIEKYNERLAQQQKHIADKSDKG